MDIKRAARVKVRKKDGGRTRNLSASNNPGEEEEEEDVEEWKINKDNGRQNYILVEAERYLWVRKKGGWAHGQEGRRLKNKPVPSVSPSNDYSDSEVETDHKLFFFN